MTIASCDLHSGRRNYAAGAVPALQTPYDGGPMNQAYGAQGLQPVDLSEIRFENTFVRELPADTVLTNTPRRVNNACYTRVEPTPVAAPRLLAWADGVGRMLGIERQPKPDRAARCLAATGCCRGCSPTRRATAATSSATGPDNSATGARSRSPKSLPRAACAGSCS